MVNQALNWNINVAFILKNFATFKLVYLGPGRGRQKVTMYALTSIPVSYGCKLCSIANKRLHNVYKNYKIVVGKYYSLRSSGMY